MNDRPVLDAMERFAPPVLDLDPDWDDVVERSRRLVAGRATGPADPRPDGPPGVGGRGRWRAGVIALVVLLVGIGTLSPVGAAVGRTVADFTDWLTGRPGRPASAREQAAFDETTRSWTGFPAGVELRRLQRVDRTGLSFTLYGFRGAGALCLRLDVTGAARARRLVCPPLVELRRRPAPAIVAAADVPIGTDPGRPAAPPLDLPAPAATVTFGIVADGIERLVIRYSDGVTRAVRVSANAFLEVRTRPGLETRVTDVWAATAGARVRIPFAPEPTSLGVTPGAAATPKATGPSRVQRRLRGGRIGWIDRREPRGAPASPGGASRPIFARVVTPDPHAPERMLVSIIRANDRYAGGRLLDRRLLCTQIVTGRYGGEGCWPIGRVFSTAPFSTAITLQEQYVTLSGLASDDVERLVLHLATGSARPVPLADNAYLIEAPRRAYPLRLVAYDGSGRVIGIKDIAASNGGGGPRPAAGARWTSALRTAIGELFTAPAADGGICYALHLRDGATTIACPGRPAPDTLDVTPATVDGRLAVAGRAGSRIVRVVVRLRSGATTSARPVDGYYLTAGAPIASGADGLESVSGLDRHGRTVTTRAFTRLVGGAGSLTRITPDAVVVNAVTCRRTAASPSLAGYRAHVEVRYLCEDGVLTLIGRTLDSRRWRDRTIWATGTIAAVGSRAVTIERSTGTPRTLVCTLAATSPDVGAYRVGERVQVFCAAHRLTGINHDR